MYTKDLNELKYQFLIKKREGAGIKDSNDPKAFMVYSAYMDDIYNDINDQTPLKKEKL